MQRGPLKVQYRNRNKQATIRISLVLIASWPSNAANADAASFNLSVHVRASLGHEDWQILYSGFHHAPVCAV